MMRRRGDSAFWVVLASLALGGCVTWVRESMTTDWVEVLPGSTLTLNRPMSVPPGQARAFFRNPPRGGIASPDGTSCALEVRRLDPAAAQTIAPGVIGITRVQNYVSLVANDRAPPLQDLAIRLQLASHGDSGGSQMLRFGFHFWLDPSHDPNLMRLTCLGRLDDPAYTRAPTLDEIRAVLAGSATLDLVTADMP
jgi:hypothetical protein